MTKTQAKRAYQAIASKAFKLFENGYATQSDLLKLADITKKALSRMK
jgi:hypothetical protein